MNSEQVELTYDGTSGWSGTDTSAAAVHDYDRDGKTGRVQQIVLKALGIAGPRGMTVAELRKYIKDAHHGQVSSALTNLHRAGRIVRLREKRDRCKVYVAIGYEQDRQVEPPAVRRPAAATILSQVQDMHTPDEVGNVHGLYCPECGVRWPCRTYKFIKSQEA